MTRLRDCDLHIIMQIYNMKYLKITFKVLTNVLLNMKTCKSLLNQ